MMKETFTLTLLPNLYQHLNKYAKILAGTNMGYKIVTKFAVWVEFHVKVETFDLFLPLVKENARLSLEREIGCERFDVLTAGGSSFNVALYELYADKAAFDFHLKTDHFRFFDVESTKLNIEKSVRTYVLEQA